VWARAILVLRLSALLLSVAAGPWSQARAAAGGIPCDDPLLFSHSDVNIGVLPFTTEAPNPDFTYRSNTYISGLQGRNKTATQLARVIQLDTLYSLRYPAGMGVVHFQGPPEACQSDVVVTRILAASEGRGLNDGKGLVTFWGRFLAVGDALYAQSFMSFFRRGIGEVVELRLGKGAEELRLSSRLSRRAVTFSARLLAEEDLQAVEQGFDRASIIWADRVGDEESGRLPQDPDEGFAFSVTDVDSVTGRMHIQPYKFVSAPSGWIEARVDPEAWPLRAKLPELSFLNAVAGYLGFRVVERERPGPNWAGQWPRRLVRARDRAVVAFRDYRRHAVPALTLDSLPLAALTARGGDRGASSGIPAAERAALGWSHGLTAAMDLILSTLEPIGAERRAVAASDAKREIERAVAFVPNDPDLLNLAALIEVRECCFDGNLSAAKTADGYLRSALAVDPGHRDSIRNLAQLYKVLEAQDAAGAIGLTEDQLSRRRATLARLVAEIRKAALDPSQPVITATFPSDDRDHGDGVGDSDRDGDDDKDGKGDPDKNEDGDDAGDGKGDPDKNEDGDDAGDGKDDPDSNGTGASESNSHGQKGHGKDSGSGNDDSTVGTDWSRGEDKCCRGRSFNDVDSGDPGKSQGKNSGRDN
jgi:hypothetical protein